MKSTKILVNHSVEKIARTWIRGPLGEGDGGVGARERGGRNECTRSTSKVSGYWARSVEDAAQNSFMSGGSGASARMVWPENGCGKAMALGEIPRNGIATWRLKGLGTEAPGDARQTRAVRESRQPAVCHTFGNRDGTQATVLGSQFPQTVIEGRSMLERTEHLDFPNPNKAALRRAPDNPERGHPCCNWDASLSR